MAPLHCIGSKHKVILINGWIWPVGRDALVKGLRAACIWGLLLLHRSHVLVVLLPDHVKIYWRAPTESKSSPTEIYHKAKSDESDKKLWYFSYMVCFLPLCCSSLCFGCAAAFRKTITYLMYQLITTFFVEHPLALPGSANYAIFLIPLHTIRAGRATTKKNS